MYCNNEAILDTVHIMLCQSVNCHDMYFVSMYIDVIDCSLVRLCLSNKGTVYCVLCTTNYYNHCSSHPHLWINVYKLSFARKNYFILHRYDCYIRKQIVYLHGQKFCVSQKDSFMSLAQYPHNNCILLVGRISEIETAHSVDTTTR